MFKNILNEISKKKVYIEGYSPSDFTIGFELEAYLNPGYADKGDVANWAQEYWQEKEVKFKGTINLDTINMSDDGTIQPPDDWTENACYECGGSGREDCLACEGTGENECEECEGSGEQPCPFCNGSQRLTCQTCNGEGKISNTCPTCEGTGEDPSGQLEISGRVAACLTCKGTGIVKEECPSCEGDGTNECSDCNSDGMTSCSNCHGEGRTSCNSCDGDGYNECRYCDGRGTNDNDDDITYEWNSAVLNFTPANIQNLILFLQEGIRQEYIHTNRSCGFHIHLGFPDKTMQSEDIFWILCQMVVKNKGQMFEDLLDFKGYDLHTDNSSTFAKTNDMKKLKFDLQKITKIIEEKYKPLIANYYDFDPEEEKYKGFQEEVYFEANKNEKLIELEMEVWNVLFYKTIIVTYYDNEKYTLMRQHPQGTLEWRGARAFMDNGDVDDVKEFILTKLYPFIKWVSQTLEDEYLNLSPTVRMSKVFFYEMLKGIEPPSPKVFANKEDNRFNRVQSMSQVSKFFNLSPEFNKMSLKHIIFKINDDNKIELTSGAIDLSIYKIIYKDKVLRKSFKQKKDATDFAGSKNLRQYEIKKFVRTTPTKNISKYDNVNFHNGKIDLGYGVFFDNGSISNSDIISGDFHDSVIVCSDGTELKEIKGGSFFGGDRKYSSIRRMKIEDGVFERITLESCFLHGGKFQDCKFVGCQSFTKKVIIKDSIWTLNDFKNDWYDGIWSEDNFIRFKDLSDRWQSEETQESDLNPKDFRKLSFKHHIVSLVYNKGGRKIKMDDLDNPEDDENFEAYKERMFDDIYP